MYIFDFICVLVYIIAQLILVVRTLDDRWPIGDILFGVAFFTIGQVILYGFGGEICDAVKHYLDSVFCECSSFTCRFDSAERFLVFELCLLLSVMMVYKCMSPTGTFLPSSYRDRLGLDHERRS